MEEKTDYNALITGLLLALFVGLSRMLPFMGDIASASMVSLSLLLTGPLFIYFAYRAYKNFITDTERARPTTEATRQHLQEVTNQKKILKETLPAELAERYRETKRTIERLPPNAQSKTQRSYMQLTKKYATNENSLKECLKEFSAKCPKQSRTGSSRELYLFGVLMSAKNNFDVDAEALSCYLKEKKPDAAVFEKQSNQTLICPISHQFFHLPVSIKKEGTEAVWDAQEKSHQTFDLTSLLEHYAKCLELLKKPYHPFDTTQHFTTDMIYLDVHAMTEMVELKIKLLQLLIEYLQEKSLVKVKEKNIPRLPIPRPSAFG